MCMNLKIKKFCLILILGILIIFPVRVNAQEDNIILMTGQKKILDMVSSSSEIHWTISDKKVIEINTVNGKTTIKGLSVGKALLTATTNGVNIKIRVTVKNNTWYKQILSDKTAVYRVPCPTYDFAKMPVKSIRRSIFNKYVLEDINGDGINELMLYNYNSKTYIRKLMVFTFYNNKIIPLIYFETYIGRSGIYVIDNNFILKSGGSDYIHCISYSLNKGKLIKNKEIFFHRYYKNDKPKYKYMIDGKKVTNKQFIQEQKKFDFDGISQVRFRKI